MTEPGLQFGTKGMGETSYQEVCKNTGEGKRHANGEHYV